MASNLTSPHIPVLLNEVLNAFKTCNDGTIVDCTTGFAGHSNKLLEENKNNLKIAKDFENLSTPFMEKYELKLPKLAQPLRYLAHNGEINTLRGNVNSLRAKEGKLKSEYFTDEEIKQMEEALKKEREATFSARKKAVGGIAAIGVTGAVF